MAFDAGILNEEEQQVVGTPAMAPQAPGAAPLPPQTQGGATPQQATIQPSGGSQRRSKTPRSGLFTNISRYIQRNQPATQRLAQETAQTAQADIGKVGQAIQQQKQSQQQQIQQAQQQRAGQLGQAQQLVQQAAQTGQLGEQDVAQFQNLQQALAGRQQLTPDTGAISQALAQAQQTAQLGQTAAGRRELLGRAFGQEGRRYTRGQQLLDQLLLQTSPEGQQQIATGLTTAAEQARQQAETEQQEAAARQQQFAEQQAAQQQALATGLETARTGLEEELGAGRQTTQQRAQQLAEQIEQAKQARQERLRQESAARERAALDRIVGGYQQIFGGAEGALGEQQVRDIMAGRIGQGFDEATSAALISPITKLNLPGKGETVQSNINRIMESLTSQFGDVARTGLRDIELEKAALQQSLGQDAVEQALQDSFNLQALRGAAGGDVSLLGVDPAARARYNALARLSGRDQLQRAAITPEMLDRLSAAIAGLNV
jgi:hypothetical protein